MKNIRKILIAVMFSSFLALAVFGFLGLAFSASFAECAQVVPGALACPSIPGQSAQQAEIFLSFSRVVLTAVLLFAVVYLTLGLIPEPASPMVPGSRTLFAVLNHSRSFFRRQLEWLAITQRSDLIG